MATYGIYTNIDRPEFKNYPLAKFRNVVLTPHIGSIAKEHGEVIQVLKGQVSKYLVSPEVMRVRPLNQEKMLE